MEKVGAYTDRATEIGEWRSGNPGLGQQATPMLAAYFNMLQRELVAVVESAGIELDEGDDEQLVKAITAIASVVPKAWSAISEKPTTLYGYGITDALRCRIGVDIEDPATSWNAIVDEGMHPKLILGSNPQGPGTANYFYCRTYVRGISGARQQFAEPYATPAGAGKMYWRGLNGDDWSPWVRVLDSTDATELSPAGEVASFARNSAPAGWLKANGAAISRTTYGALFAAIGTTFGAGDGSTTFNLPDLRGEFVRGWDDGRGVDSGRAFGSSQKGSLVTFDPTSVSTALTALHSTGADGTARVDIGLDAINSSEYPGIDVGSAAAGSTLTVSSAAGVSRPRNIALLACIKY
jgi:microcystin-dependent protein